MRSRDAKFDQITVARLISLPRGEMDEGARTFLIAQVPTLSLDLLLDLLGNHGNLGVPQVFVDALAPHLGPSAIPFLFSEGGQLAAALEEDGYADLAERLIRTVDDPRRAGFSRTILRHVRGNARFNLAVAADPGLGAPLLSARTDPGACLRTLTALASASLEDAHLIWSAAQHARDVDLEAAVLPSVLRVFDLHWHGTDPLPAGLGPLIESVVAWVGSPGQRDGREDAIWQQLESAHAAGHSWSAIAFVIPEELPRLRARAAQRAWEEGERTHQVLAPLQEDLARGDEAAWHRLFAWIAEAPGDLLPLWACVRDGELPATPDDAFWGSFLEAWAAAAQARATELGHYHAADESTDPLPTRRIDEYLLRRQPRLLRPMDDAALFERIVSRPPTRTSGGALARLLGAQPDRLGDARVLSFVGNPDCAALAGSINLDGVIGAGDHAVHTLRQLCGQAADESLRRHLLVLATSRGAGAFGPASWPAIGWITQVADAEVLDVGRRALLALPVRQLVRAIGDTETWVTRDEVSDAVAHASELGSQLDGLPHWLDGALLARLATCPLSEAPALVDRLASRYPRGRLIDVLLPRLGVTPDGQLVSALAGLLGSRSAWDEDGPRAVAAVVSSCPPRALFVLLDGPLTREAPSKPPGEPARNLRVLHHALAQGLLIWATQRLEVGDHGSVETGLTAIAHLDPPPPFTRRLRAFARHPRITDVERHWAERLEALAKHGGRDATATALRYCIEELANGGEP